MEPRSSSWSVEGLIPIWQSILSRSPVHADDSFFDLGGNPSLAVKLFDEIARACGRELPTLAIYHAPTIATMVKVFSQPSLPQLSPLVPLKVGDVEPPIFLAPGLGGSVMEFFTLVKRIRTRHPIYGLQAISSDGADIQLERIEDMAQFYLEAIRQRQPRGPYFLIGYSLGGLVALEMAHRLTRIGEKIGLLAMLDAYPHESFLCTWQRACILRRVVRYHVSIAKELPFRRAFSYLSRPAERARHASQKGSEPFVRSPFTYAMRQVRDRAYLALTKYRPSRYSGKIRFVKAAGESVFPTDPAEAWRPWVSDLDVEVVPGDHYAMINQYSDSLALVVSRYLQEVFQKLSHQASTATPLGDSSSPQLRQGSHPWT